MGGIGIWQIVIVAVVILILFGRGRISEMMGDFGKGISSFKKGMDEDDSASPKQAAQIESPEGESVSAPSKSATTSKASKTSKTTSKTSKDASE